MDEKKTWCLSCEESNALLHLPKQLDKIIILLKGIDKKIDDLDRGRRL